MTSLEADSVVGLLGPEGPFARKLPAYEARDGQLEVTRAVGQLLAEDGILLCEAGTGIGKTFAYLVPALLSGRKVVISTATRALQDQIAGRDIPLALEVLGIDARVAVMKGLSNYLCRRRYAEFIKSPEALRPQHHEPLRNIQRFLEETELGDLSELVTLPEASATRLHVASSSETRLGPPCGHFADCFVTHMKRAAEEANVIVVNHHLFFADLALRGPHPGRVLPDYDAVILDEAHQIEDTASLFFGVRVTSQQVLRVVEDSKRSLRRTCAPARFLEEAAAHLLSSLARCAKAGRTILPPETWQGELGEIRLTLLRNLSDLSATLRSYADASPDAETREPLEHLSRRVDLLHERLEEVTRERSGRVTWMEISAGKLALSSTPVDLSEVLKDRLFGEVPAVGLLSATLTTSASEEGSGFSFVRSRLGVPEEIATRQLSVPSPFDYEKNCLLYVPDDLPAPSASDFLEKAAERTTEMIRLTGGGAFVLTTSVASMRQLHARLVRSLPGTTVWMQGQRPKESLLSAFRASQSGVLVATASFWEGIDVPGSALRLLVLEKIPFSVPTDPVFQARSDALTRAGKNAFFDFAVPEAAIRLKQGFGRLIRRHDDRGVVALLDDRIYTKGYGKRLLRALPPARQERSFARAREFLTSLHPVDRVAPEQT